MLSEQQQRIMGYFIEEAKDHLNTIEQGLVNLQATIADSEMVHEVFRAAHSVKGGAAMLGLSSIQRTAHRLEDYFKVLKECPQVRVDQKLETLFLRVFDTLQELVEQLQGPFGLTEEKAADAMTAVEPVFADLNQHLNQLVAQAGGTTPEDVNLVEMSVPVVLRPTASVSHPTTPQPAVAEESALKFIFQNDVPARLREMLQLFKQPETTETRTQLQDICRQLAQPGEQFELPQWCELIDIAQRAIGNSDHTYRTLAPIVIKNIKRAQELVLAGQSSAIEVGEDLSLLLPPEPEPEVMSDEAALTDLFTDLDVFSDLATAESVEAEITQASEPAAEPDLAFSFFDGDEAEESVTSDDWLTNELSNHDNLNTPLFTTEEELDLGLTLNFDAVTSDIDQAEADASGFDLLDQLGQLDGNSLASSSIDRHGPEVGTAELNSLADLFEGEMPDLGLTWQEEQVLQEVGEEPLPSGFGKEVASDFSDLFFDGDGSEDLVLDDGEDEDLSGLLDAAAFQATRPADGSDSVPEINSQTSEPIADLGIADLDMTDLDIADLDMADLDMADLATLPESIDPAIEPADDMFLFLDQDTDLSDTHSAAINEPPPENRGVLQNLDDLFAGIEIDEFAAEQPTHSSDPSQTAADDFDALFGDNTAEATSPPVVDLSDLWASVPEAPVAPPAVPLTSPPDQEANQDTFADLWAEENQPAAPEVEPSTVADIAIEANSDIEPFDLFADVADNLEGDLEGIEISLEEASEADLDAIFASEEAESEPEGDRVGLEDDWFNSPVEPEPLAVEAEAEEAEFDLNFEAEQPENEQVAASADLNFDFALEGSEATAFNTQAEQPNELTLPPSDFESVLAAEVDLDSLLENSDTEATTSLDLDAELDSDLGLDLEPQLQAADTGFESELDTELNSDFSLDDSSIALSFEDELTASDQASEASDLLDDFDLFAVGDSEAITAIDDVEADEIQIDEIQTDEIEALTAAEFAATEVEFGSAESNGANAELDLDSLELDSLTQAEAPSDDEFANLESMLGEAEFGEAENFLSTPESSAAATEADEFADLEALLLTEPPAPSETIATDEFADLEALLDSEPVSEPVPTAPAAAPVAPAISEDEFGDLEALLQEADQKLGVGSSPARGGTSAAARRPTRRNVIADQTMRVSVKHLDNLNNLVGELVVNRNSLEQTQERLRQFLDNLLYQVQQLGDVGQRMRDLYERSLLESSLLSSRRSYNLTGSSLMSSSSQTSHATGVSFDALEMDRFTGFHTLSQEMIELIVRVRESASDIDFVVEESDQVTRNFRQITTQLQEGLTRSRMVPFSQMADRLPRGVRDNAIKYGKQAELLIEGRDTLIDKMIVEQLYDPMTHLVNNAIAHGIETPEERIAAGKSPTGRITIRTFHQGNQTVISVSDDGAGINTDRVRAKALAKGVITAADAQQMSRLDIYDLLFHHGFSTADQVDDLRGRGVGLDVVRNNLSEIRGVISIDSAVGKGTTFTIRLPLTLSISKALCCISNRARIAFPMDGVEDMLDVPKERIITDDQGRSCIQWRDTLLPFQPLAELLRYNRVLGRSSVYGGTQDDDMLPVVVLRSAGNYLALQVDQVLGEQEIVIKQLEGPVPKPVGVAGATVLGDGRIMPIADVLELIDLSQGRIRREANTALWESGEQVPVDTTPAKTESTVLIVDDSITVRELLSMTFNKVGYRVEQARDGQEAWEKLRSGLPCDLVFCDIEMPRMDGLELLSRIQKDPHLNGLPIAMLTSRGADRHRQMAVQLGAKGYFTKPYLEEVLLDAAQRMLKGEVLVTGSVTE